MCSPSLRSCCPLRWWLVEYHSDANGEHIFLGHGDANKAKECNIPLHSSDTTISSRHSTKKYNVYHHNERQAERSFSIPTSRSIALNLIRQCLQENPGAPLMQYLDDSLDQGSWKALVDNLYTDQDVWEDIHKQPVTVEVAPLGSCNVNLVQYFVCGQTSS